MRSGLSRSQTSVNGDYRIPDPIECALICSGLLLGLVTPFQVKKTVSIEAYDVGYIRAPCSV